MEQEIEVRDSDLGRFVKAGGIILAILATMTVGLWQVADINTRITATELRISQNQKDIDKLSDRTDSLEKTINDMARKLDVAVEILKRLDSEKHAAGK